MIHNILESSSAATGDSGFIEKSVDNGIAPTTLLNSHDGASQQEILENIANIGGTQSKITKDARVDLSDTGNVRVSFKFPQAYFKYKVMINLIGYILETG